MNKLIILLIFLFTPALGAHLHPEKYYQEQWCSRWHGRTEVKLKDYTRVDCVTKNYAVEFDFAQKWAEGVGQSLYYGKMTGKKPALILIIEKPSDFRYYYRAQKLSEDFGFKLWYMKPPEYQNTKNQSMEKYLIALEKIKANIEIMLK